MGRRPAVRGCGPPYSAHSRYLRSHRETVHLTRSRANLRRLRAAHTEIEAEIARRRRGAG